MRKIALLCFITIFCYASLSYGDDSILSYDDNSVFEVDVQLDKNTVLRGEHFNIKARILNTSLTVQEFETYVVGMRWMVDNENISLVQSLLSFQNAQIPVVLKPGEFYEETITMIVKDQEKSEQISFRFGFQPTNTWSDPVSVNVQVEPVLPIKVTISTEKDVIKSNEQPWVDVILTNTSNNKQDFFIDEKQGDLFLNADQNAMRRSIFPLGQVLQRIQLDAGESFTTKMKLMYWRERPNDEPDVFKIGFRPIGYFQTLWSDPIELDVEYVPGPPMLSMRATGKKGDHVEYTIWLSNRTEKDINFDPKNFKIEMSDPPDGVYFNMIKDANLEMMGVESQSIKVDKYSGLYKGVVWFTSDKAGTVSFRIGIKPEGFAEAIWSNNTLLNFPDK